MKNGYNTTGSAVLYPFICLKFICRYVVVKKMPGSLHSYCFSEVKGRMIMKSEPFPSSLSTVIVPPKRVTIFFT